MGTDPVRGPVPVRAYPEIMSGDAETLFRSPSAEIAGQRLCGGQVAHVGGHAQEPIPSLRLGELRLVDHQPGIALHGEEALHTLVRDQFTGIAAPLQLA